MKKETMWLLLTWFGEEPLGGTNDLSDLTQRTENCTGDEVSASAAGEQPSKEAGEREFRELMEGKYKAHFTEYFQETFNRRFKEQKNRLEELERTRPVMQALSERFGTKDEGELIAAIRAEQERSKAPTEAASPKTPLSKERSFEEPVAEAELSAMVQKAVAEAVKEARAETERAVLDRIRARGLRPTEGALTPGVGRTFQSSVSRLSKKERAEMARRAATGERIEF